MQSKLIEVQNTPNGTSDTIANLVKEALVKIGIYAKCVAFTGDNCNTNFCGASRKKGNNVFSKLRDDNPDLIGVGCPAHITNNCIHHGANQLIAERGGFLFCLA